MYTDADAHTDAHTDAVRVSIELLNVRREAVDTDSEKVKQKSREERRRDDAEGDETRRQEERVK